MIKVNIGDFVEIRSNNPHSPFIAKILRIEFSQSLYYYVQCLNKNHEKYYFHEKEINRVLTQEEIVEFLLEN